MPQSPHQRHRPVTRSTADANGCRAMPGRRAVQAILLAGFALATIAAGAAPQHLGPGILLVADERLLDPNFARSVILLVEYSREDGAFGLIVNQPTKHRVRDVMPPLTKHSNETGLLHRGGPVSPERVFVLIRSEEPVPDATPIVDRLHLTVSPSVLEKALSATAGTSSVRVFAGYAGWGAGQLESELARGDWHLREATAQRAMAPDTRGLWRELWEIGRGLWVRRSGPSNRAPEDGLERTL